MSGRQVGTLVDDKLSVELKALYDQWEQAIQAKDWGWFERHFADDWLGTRKDLRAMHARGATVIREPAVRRLSPSEQTGGRPWTPAAKPDAAISHRLPSCRLHRVAEWLMEPMGVDA